MSDYCANLVKKVMQTIFAFWPQSGKPDMEKVHFCDEIANGWDLKSSSKIISSLGISMVVWENVLRVLRAYIRGMELERDL